MQTIKFDYPMVRLEEGVQFKLDSFDPELEIAIAQPSGRVNSDWYFVGNVIAANGSVSTRTVRVRSTDIATAFKQVQRRCTRSGAELVPAEWTFEVLENDNGPGIGFDVFQD